MIRLFFYRITLLFSILFLGFLNFALAINPPVAINDTLSVGEDNILIIQPLLNDSDPDGDSIYVNIITAPQNGTAINNNDGTITYAPYFNYFGIDSIQYRLCDTSSLGLCDTAWIYIDVLPLNDEVNVDEFYASVNAGDSILFPLGDLLFDFDDTTFMITITSQPDSGMAVLIGDSVKYVAPPGFSGSDTIPYTACDDSGFCESSSVIVQVPYSNSPPFAQFEAVTGIVENQTVKAAVLENDYDPDFPSDTLTLSILMGAMNGSASIVGDDTIQYTPNNNFNGQDQVVYIITDVAGGTDTSQVVFFVQSVNSAPDANLDVITIVEDTSSVTIPVQSNDVDDGVSLFTSILNDANDGSTLVLNNDSIRYIPNPDFSGSDTIRYEVCDYSSPNLCDDTLVIITVTPVNDIPVATNDLETIDEDVVSIFNVQANDNDVDGDNLITSVVTTAANGSVLLLNDDSIQYTPNAHFNGNDTIAYQVCDPSSACDTALLIITINSINDIPVALNDTNVLNEDTLIVIDVQTNDSDADGENLVTSIVTIASNGNTLLLNNDSIRYTPANNFNGNDTITYQVCDPSLACDTALIILTINSINDSPVALDDSEVIDEDIVTIFNVQNNDSDIDGDNLITSFVTPPSNGSVSLLNNDSVRYTPNANFNGNDTITYRVCDDSLACDTAEVIITINAINDAPLAMDDSANPDENETVIIDVQANDMDIEGDAMTTSIVSGPPFGSTTIIGGNTIQYTPNLNYDRNDTIVYRVCDPSLACDTAVVYITIKSINNTPIAVSDVDTTNEDDLVVVDVQANDSDVEGDNLITSIITTASNGNVLVLNNDSVRYTPNANFNGNDTITYRVCDPFSACDTALLVITVNAINDVPLALDDSYSIDEDSISVFDVQNNDIDIDGDNLVTSIIGTALNGSVLLLNNDSIEYTPNANFNGNDTIIYRVCDPSSACDTASLFITVNSTNDSPVALNDSESTDEEISLVINVQSNDNDIDGDNLITSIVSLASNGSVLLLNNDSVRYTPNANFNGNDTITYRVCDPSSACDTAVLIISVTPINDSPLALNDNGITNEEVAVVVDVQNNDNDVDGDNLVTSIVAVPSNGSLLLLNNDSIQYTPGGNFNGNDTITYRVCDPSLVCDTAFLFITVNSVNDAPVALDDNESTDEEIEIVIDVQNNDSDVEGDNLVTSILNSASNGSVLLLNNDSIRYTPNANFNGNDTIVYQVCDPFLGCDTASLFILVNPINDIPVAVNDVAVGNSDDTLYIDVVANDSDVDDAILSVTILVQPDSGNAIVIGDTVRYISTASPASNLVDTIVYTICDPSLGCDTAFVFVFTPSQDLPPNAIMDSVSTNEEIAVQFSIIANDSDPNLPNDSLTTTLISNANNGVSTLSNDTLFYLPNSNFNGRDTMEYALCDTTGLCDTALVVVIVNPVNDAPVAVSDNESTNEDILINIDVQANDTDIDGDNLNTLIVMSPNNGIATLLDNDSIRYTPNANFNGNDTIIYQVCDPFSVCDTATVFITVNPISDIPEAINDSITTNEEIVVIANVQNNDSDADGDALITSIISIPSNGNFLLLNNDSIQYTPNLNYNGNDTIVYQVCDPSSACDTATLVITVLPVNDIPIAINDNESTNEDVMVVINVQANDSDPDNDNLITSILTGPSNGSAIVLGNDSIQYNPSLAFNGNDTIIYRVCDPSSACDTAIVFISVNSVNNLPVAQDDNESTNEDVPINIDVQANDIDIDGDNLFTSIVSTPLNGNAVVLNNDSILYTPNSNFNGFDTVFYRVCDALSACDTAMIKITISAVNDSPIAVDDTELINEDEVLVSNVQNNDIDFDGDILITSVLTPPTNGNVFLLNNDSIRYTPNNNFNGVDIITYIVCDPLSLCDTATLTIIVDPVNDKPIALDDSDIVDEDATTVVDIQVNDTDIDGDNLTTSIVTLPRNGQVLVLNNDSVSFAPNAHFNGNDTIIYRVCDPFSACDTAMLTITINSVNDIPVANNDIITGNSTDTFYVSILNNDFDVDDTVFTTRIIAQPDSGNAVLINDTIRYISNASPASNVSDTVQYEICDPSLACDTAYVIVITPSQNLPPIGLNDSIVTNEDVTTQVQLLDNDGDPNFPLDSIFATILLNANNGLASLSGDTLSYIPDPDFNGRDSVYYTVCDTTGLCDTALVIITVNPSNDKPTAVDDNLMTDEDLGLIANVQGNDNDIDGDNLVTSILTNSTNGTLTLLNSDSVQYIPNANFNGLDTVTYMVCDPLSLCDTANLIITVNPVNDAPQSIADNATTDEDLLVIIDVQDNDMDIDGDVLTSNIVSGPDNGVVSVLNTDSIEYTPFSDFNGNDTITYRVCDPSSACDTAIIIITVNPINDKPTAVSDNAITDEDLGLIVDVQGNDNDIDGDNLLTFILTNSTNGTLTLLNSDSVQYIPNTDFNGLDTVTYMVCDPLSLCDTANLIITVNPVNDAPQAITDNATTDEDLLVVIDVQDNDMDIDGDVLMSSIVSGPSNGSISILNTDSIEYTPSLDFNGNDTITYRICDPSSACDTAIIIITVNPINDKPTAVSDNAITDEDLGLIVDVQGNDNDIDGDVLISSIVNSPENGTVSVLNTDSIEYIPNADFNGMDTITYRVCDFLSLCDTTSVVITVNPINDIPLAFDDYDTTNVNTSVTTDVLVNDIDIDGDNLSISVLQFPANGSIAVIGGNVTYNPNTSFIGADSIVYLVCDAFFACDTATMFIEVIPVNNPPIAVNDTVDVYNNPIVFVNVLSNDIDVNGNSLTMDIIGNPTKGTAIELIGDSLLYSPFIGAVGYDTITYMACDELGLCDTAIVWINNLVLPVANDDQNNVINAIDTVINVQVNDINPNENPLLTSILSGPYHGTYVLLNSDSISYDVDDFYCGIDTIVYEVCISGYSSLCDTATLYISTIYTDVDEDSIPDVVETFTIDTDMDGIPDYQDTDADNDGITDIIEDGGRSVCNTLKERIDTDNDGIPNYIDSDSDGDGVDDLSEGINDCDDDGIPNYLDLNPCGILAIPQGFSPNGDGEQDVWRIPGLDEYPDNKLTILNRWGTVVYEKFSYSNDWDGRANKGILIDNGVLPVGTYFYILELGKGEQSYTGYVYINK